MSDLVVLEALKSFLEEEVASQIKFKKANDENVMNYELVNPSVYIGWVPPNGNLSKEIDLSVPCILVGHDEGEDDGKDATLDIRLSFILFNPGFKGNDNNLTPDYEGYKDLLTLVHRVKRAFQTQKIIKETTTIRNPIKWGMYLEQPYPYWHGWLTFKVQMQVERHSTEEINKYL